MAALVLQKHAAGFTLIELIVVLVITAIVSAMGSQFIVSSTEMYVNTSEKSRLINVGRQAIERISRQVRGALPNSVRVSASGNCVEFLPTVAGSFYIDQVPDLENAAPASTGVDTAPFSLGFGAAAYVSIGASDVSEIYSAAPGSIVSLGGFVGTPIETVNFASAKQFVRNSTTNRIFITDSPIKFCVNNSDELRVYTSYGLPTDGLTGLTDTEPNAGVLMAENVLLDSETPFLLSGETETRNTVLNMQLPFVDTNGSTRVVLDHRVMIKNVP